MPTEYDTRKKKSTIKLVSGRHSEGVFKVALLTWRQFMIEHHDIRFVQPHYVTDFGDLAHFRPRHCRPDDP